MSRGLLERAFRIAGKQHGILCGKKNVGINVNEHTAGVNAVAVVMKLLRTFPPEDKLACRAAYNLCTIMGNSTHLTPGPALKNALKLSYFQSRRLREEITEEVQDTPSFLKVWEWILKGMEQRVMDWKEVGITMDDVLELVWRARTGGNKLNRREYTEILKICLCIHEGHYSPGLQEGCGPLGELLAVMVSDCGVDAARDVLLSSSFQVTISEEQIRVTSHLLSEVGSARPLVFQGEQLSASLIVDSHTQNVVNLFTQYMLSSDVPPTMKTYEELLSSCARTYQLNWARNIFHSFTHRYRIAPSREVYSILTILMYRRALNKDKRVNRKLCHRVLADTVRVFAEKPPLWVYAEMARPLVQLVGLEGYHTMFEKCEERLDDMNIYEHNERKMKLRKVWRPFLYTSFIKTAVMFNDRELALHMLSEMKGWGYVINTSVYENLLQLVERPNHLKFYLPMLLKGLADDVTSSRAVFLQGPLMAALSRIYHYKSKDTQVPSFIPAAARGLLDATLLSTAHHHCIQHLERLASSNKISSYHIKPTSFQEQDLSLPASQQSLQL